MGSLIRSYDWSSTGLGSFTNWPLSLKTSVAIMLRSGYTIFVWWGPEMIMFYNDAYIPVLGKKHPYALGKPARQIWSEIWEQIGPMMDQVLNKGEQIYARDLLFLIERNGFIEESYFTFSYSPIPDDEGGVGGIFCACNEETPKVLRQRRLKTLKDISSMTTQLRSLDEVFDTCGNILSENPNDIPFSILYRFNRETEEAELAAYTGFTTAVHKAMPQNIRIDDPATWPLHVVMNSGKPVIAERLTERFGPLPGGPWSDSPEKAIIVPIQKSGQEFPAGFLVSGISAKLEFDEEYRTYFDLIATQISSAIANVNAFEVERKRIEALAEIDRAKTAFFSNISHEFRTPLTLILGPLEQLVNGYHKELPPQCREDLESMHRNSMRLLRLVNTLLDFSRIEAGRLQARFFPVDLCDFITDLAGSFRSLVENAGLQFVVNCEKKKEPVYADREMWEKIVLNLLSNAYKYTLKGKIELCLFQDKHNVVFRVKDTGVGIPQNEIPKMFERFHRVNNAMGRTHEGTGIGLSLVKELVHLHKGNISVNSEEGKGSVFTVTMPVGKNHLPAEQVFEEAEGYHESGLRNLHLSEAASLLTDSNKIHYKGAEPIAENGMLRENTEDKKELILIVDDNADMRQYIMRLLKTSYQVESASNGREALDKIQLERPALIICDIMMPVMDGIELLGILRHRVDTSTTPVILLSARAGEEAKIEGYNFGADDYLIKPFSAKELLARVQSQIKTSKIRASAENHLRSLFLQAPVAIAIYRGPEFIIELANAKVLEFWGRTEEQVLHKPLFEALPEVDKDLYFPKLTQVFTTGEEFYGPESPVTLLRKGKLENVYVNYALVPLRDLDDNITSVMVVANEVTELVNARKLAERDAAELDKKVKERTSELVHKNEELLHQKEFIETILDTSVDLVCVYDRECRFMIMNKQCAELTQLDQKEVIGKKFDEVFPSLKNSEVHNYLKRALKGEPTYNVTYTSEITGNLYTNYYIPLVRNNEVYGVVVIAHDNTEIIRTSEKLKQTNTELIRINDDLEQFAYIASHDLQEPLRKIQTFSDILQQNLNNKETATRYADKIISSSDRMMTLIQAVLNYSRLSRKGDHYGPVNLNQILKEVITDFELLIAEKEAKIVYEKLPPINGAELQISQLFSNLISNSLKFSIKKPVIEITSALVSQEEAKKYPQLYGDTEYVQLIFKDNGIGFEQKYATQVFAIFSRLNKYEYSGTGIGLAVCKKIVENHNGAISVESKPEQGTSFKILLPWQEVE